MNPISTFKPAIEERGHADDEGTTADDLEHGRHAAPLVRDAGDYHGKHRSEDAYLRN
jgi:hypothetical protein